MVPTKPGQLSGGSLIKKVPSLYTEAQVKEWLVCIGYPNAKYVQPSSFDANVQNLFLLTRLQLITFPFENVEIHYTARRAVTVSHEFLFEHMVREKGRFGGPCFSLNGIMVEMLRGLGYRAYSGAARIIQSDEASPRFSSLQHQVIFVQPTLDGTETYVIDVGYGAGPVSPILLSAEPSNVVPGAAPPEEYRLVQMANPCSSLAIAPVNWRLETRCGKLQPKWRGIYEFAETEYFNSDFSVWTYAGSTRADDPPLWTSAFVANVICIRHYVIDETTGHVGRLIMVRNEVKRQVGDKVELIQTLRSERERVTALRKIFGVGVEYDDIKHIRGKHCALPMEDETRSRL